MSNVIALRQPTAAVMDVLAARQALADCKPSDPDWRELAVEAEAAWQVLVERCGNTHAATLALMVAP